MGDGIGPFLAAPALALAADTVNDLELARIAAQNRLQALTTPPPWGHGLTPHNPDVMRMQELFVDLMAAEAQATKNLQLAVQEHPLGAWQRSRKYVGEKQLGRLLGAIRDPYWNDLHGRPRKLRELYAYCGLHVIDGDTAHSRSASQFGRGGVAPTRASGQRDAWNTSARMRVWNIAVTQMRGPGAFYRPVYDEYRARCAGAIHERACVRCGPKGNPALPGSPLSDAHSHARAIRAISKAILRDLWEEARRLHKDAQ